MQLGWLGTSGLAEVALRCARGTRYCREALLALAGVEPVTGTTPTVREFAVRHAGPGPRWPWSGWPTRAIWAAWPWPSWSATRATARSTADEAEHGLLVAVTERRTRSRDRGVRAALDKAVR